MITTNEMTFSAVEVSQKNNFVSDFINKKQKKTNKKKITEFSAASRRNLYKFLMNSKSEFNYFLTLTVKQKILDGKQFKKIIDKYLKYIMRKNKIKTACWFLEFQKNGNPHLHIYLDIALNNYKDMKKFRSESEVYFAVECVEDASIVSTCQNLTKLFGGRENLVNYGIKYARKNDQKIIPKNYFDVGRFWGVRGSRALVTKKLLYKVDLSKKFHRDIVEVIKKVLSKKASINNMFIVEKADYINTYYDFASRDNVKKSYKMLDKIKLFLEKHNIECSVRDCFYDDDEKLIKSFNKLHYKYSKELNNTKNRYIKYKMMLKIAKMSYKISEKYQNMSFIRQNVKYVSQFDDFCGKIGKLVKC